MSKASMTLKGNSASRDGVAKKGSQRPRGSRSSRVRFHYHSIDVVLGFNSAAIQYLKEGRLAQTKAVNER